MVGQQHQGAADQVGATIATHTAPGLGQTFMDRSARRSAGHRVGQHVQQGRSLHRQGQGMAAQRRRIEPRPPGERQEGPGAHVLARRRRSPRAPLQGRPVPAAQQPGDGLQRLGLRKADGVPPPVIEPALDHRGDRGVQHRLPPGDGPGRHGGGLPSSGLALGQARHIGRPIEAAPGIGGIGAGAHPSPARIGVEGLAAHLQTGAGLFGADPVGH